MTGKKIIFFSRQLTSFSKIVERSFVGSNEPVNLCKIQGSSFDGFFWANFSKFFRTQTLGGRPVTRRWPRAGPRRQRRVWCTDPTLGGRPLAGLRRAPGLEASEGCVAPTQRWGEGRSRGCAARRALRPAKTVVHRPNAEGKAARGDAPRAGPRRQRRVWCTDPTLGGRPLAGLRRAPGLEASEECAAPTHPLREGRSRGHPA